MPRASASRLIPVVFVALCIAAVALNGCGDTKKRLGELEKKSAEEGARINDLEWKTASTKFTAKLSPDTDSYSRLDTGAGHFFVYLKEASAYQDGYGLVISIGNPNYMTVHGGQIELIWGEGPDKKKAYTFTQVLEPGLWNDMEVFITPATAEDVKNISMSMSVSSISFLSRRE